MLLQLVALGHGGVPRHPQAFRLGLQLLRLSRVVGVRIVILVDRRKPFMSSTCSPLRRSS